MALLHSRTEIRYGLGLRFLYYAEIESRDLSRVHASEHFLHGTIQSLGLESESESVSESKSGSVIKPYVLLAIPIR